MLKNIKKRAGHRLKIIEGQIRGLEKMVDKEEYCVDILRQTSAVKKALSSVEDLILENHLSTHVIEQIKNGKRQKSIHEVLKIYQLSKRK